MASASVLRRAQAVRQREEKRLETDKSGFIHIGDFEPMPAWRRVVSKAILVNIVARMNQTVQEMADLSHKANLQGKNGKEEKDLWAMDIVTFEEVIARERLPMSKGQAGLQSASSCSHSQKLHHRGNDQTLW